MRHHFARAAYALARAFGAAPVVERAISRTGMTARVMPDQAIWHQFQRIGGSLTPQRVSWILRLADTGDLTSYIDLLNESRQKDGHLQGILSQVEESIAELDWTLTVPEQSRKKDRTACAWVESRLRATTGQSDDDTKGLGDLISHLSGAFYYGHAVAETRWEKTSDKKLAPKGFELLAARRFGYRQGDAAFIWRDETTGYEGVRLQEAHPNKFIIAQVRVNGDVPVREGLGRVLMWCALFRNWSLSDWLRTAELAWKPWRIGTYQKGASDKDIEDLKAVVDDLVTSGSAVLPETTEFKVEWPGGSGGSSSRPTHSELHNVIAQEMSKAALGATETVQSSSSSGYAQAKVHAGVTKTILRARARQIAAVITRDLVRPMIELNFGKDVVIPTFAFTLPDPVDIQQFGKGIKDLTAAGVKLSQSWVRSRIGAPEPKADEELLVPIGASEGAPNTNGEPSDGDTGGGEDAGDGEADPQAA